jgi:hypothetical protein
MTPMEALKVLDHVAAEMQMNRNDHLKAQEAFLILKEFIEGKENVKS